MHIDVDIFNVLPDVLYPENIIMFSAEIDSINTFTGKATISAIDGLQEAEKELLYSNGEEIPFFYHCQYYKDLVAGIDVEADRFAKMQSTASLAYEEEERVICVLYVPDEEEEIEQFQYIMTHSDKEELVPCRKELLEIYLYKTDGPTAINVVMLYDPLSRKIVTPVDTGVVFPMDMSDSSYVAWVFEYLQENVHPTTLWATEPIGRSEALSGTSDVPANPYLAYDISGSSFGSPDFSLICSYSGQYRWDRDQVSRVNQFVDIDTPAALIKLDPLTTTVTGYRTVDQASSQYRYLGTGVTYTPSMTHEDEDSQQFSAASLYAKTTIQNIDLENSIRQVTGVVSYEGGYHTFGAGSAVYYVNDSDYDLDMHYKCTIRINDLSSQNSSDYSDYYFTSPPYCRYVAIYTGKSREDIDKTATAHDYVITTSWNTSPFASFSLSEHAINYKANTGVWPNVWQYYITEASDLDVSLIINNEVLITGGYGVYGVACVYHLKNTETLDLVGDFSYPTPAPGDYDYNYTDYDVYSDNTIAYYPEIPDVASGDISNKTELADSMTSIPANKQDELDEAMATLIEYWQENVIDVLALTKTHSEMASLRYSVKMRAYSLLDNAAIT